MVVKECQVYFNFLPIKLEIIIRTAKFLQQFIASLNNLCMLFSASATYQLKSIFAQFGRVCTASQLANIIKEQFYNRL